MFDGLFFVVATGQSMKDFDCSLLDEKRVVAVSDAYKLFPKALCLVSTDVKWWEEKKPNFDGRRYCGSKTPLAEKWNGITTETNSGCFGIKMARAYGAKKIILLGFDMHGTHFFGPHEKPLKNPDPKRFIFFIHQFEKEKMLCDAAGVEVINCTPGTKLKTFKTGDLKDYL